VETEPGRCYRAMVSPLRLLLPLQRIEKGDPLSPSDRTQ
jgi:hypothetical protein